MAGILLPRGCCCADCADGTCPSDFLAITFAGIEACGTCVTCPASGGGTRRTAWTNIAALNGFTFNVPRTSGLGFPQIYSGLFSANGAQLHFQNSSCVTTVTYDYIEFCFAVGPGCQMNGTARMAPSTGIGPCVVATTDCISVFAVTGGDSAITGCSFSKNNGLLPCGNNNIAAKNGSASFVLL